MDERSTGSGISRLLNDIKMIGYNKDVDIELATVTSISPLKIKVDNMKIELEGSDLIVSESLLDHTRTFSITGGNVNGAMASYSHTHTESGGGTTSEDIHEHTLNKLDITNGTLTIESPLSANDRVIVANVNDGQTYIILDKAVTV